MSYFDDCLYFSANQLARRLNRIADAAFKDLDVTATQGFTLLAVGELDKHTPSDIATELQMTPSTITRFLDKLEKLGYIERTYHGRRTEVTLTPAGVDMLAKINACWRQIHDVIYEVLGAEGAERLSLDNAAANQLLRDNRAS